jgi:uncharacterized membrane protein YfcA|tara:strand:+ start:71 stop:274 length:204 start_codon:yes stop_codon:yes gene_type:complete
MDIQIAIIILFVGFCSSFITSLMGAGGSLISVPALIFMGLSPNIAVATTRFGSLGGAFSSIVRFHLS